MLTRCCRNSLKAAPEASRWAEAAGCRGLIRDATSERLHADFSISYLDEVYVRLTLASFLALRPGFAEDDIPVEPFHLDVPHRRLDCRRLRLAGFLDGRRGCTDAVIAAEALGASGEIEAALLPFGDEIVRRLRIRRLLGKPRQEGCQMHGAIGSRTGLRDDLVRVLRTAGGDDAFLHAERRRLLEDQRELIPPGGDDDGLGIRALDLGELRAHVLRALIHGLDQADADALFLEHLAEIFSRPASPVVVDDQEVGLLEIVLVDDVSEGNGLHR